jgi:hypothetical protein
MPQTQQAFFKSAWIARSSRAMTDQVVEHVDQ